MNNYTPSHWHENECKAFIMSYAEPATAPCICKEVKAAHQRGREFEQEINRPLFPCEDAARIVDNYFSQFTPLNDAERNLAETHREIILHELKRGDGTAARWDTISQDTIYRDSNAASQTP